MARRRKPTLAVVAGFALAVALCGGAGGVMFWLGFEAFGPAKVKADRHLNPETGRPWTTRELQAFVGREPSDVIRAFGQPDRAERVGLLKIDENEVRRTETGRKFVYDGLGVHPETGAPSKRAEFVLDAGGKVWGVFDY